MAALFGVAGLLAPAVVLGSSGFATDVPDSTRVFVTASSMASLNMGVYYLVAAATRWRPFFRFTVPFRLLTCAVFTTLVLTGVAPGGFLGVAAWEGAGAVATGLALAWDARRR
ncbi:hypothetical protein [Actinoplanes sp. DH11]|uniref:hypothetical protein n=1 Tax=Actinoplanes sp. DH11 TaxID=2857011 RepID=UPI001E56B856|nr:hypothetical protein [Actinoplanes sp. DH11]